MLSARRRMGGLASAAIAAGSATVVAPSAAGALRQMSSSPPQHGGKGSPPAGGRPPKRAQDTARFLQSLAAEAAAATNKRMNEPRAQEDRSRAAKARPTEDFTGMSSSEVLVMMLERQIKEIEDSLRLDQRAFANLDLDEEADRYLGDHSFTVDEDQAFTLARLAQADALGMNLRERARSSKSYDGEGNRIADDDDDLFKEDDGSLNMGEDDGPAGELADSDDESGVSHPGMLDTAKLSRIAQFLGKSEEAADSDDSFTDSAVTRKKKRVDLKRQYKIDITHKNLELLSNFVSDTGRIVSARQSGLAARSQRKIARTIKRARHAGLLPYLAKLPEFAPYEHIDHQGLKNDGGAAAFGNVARDSSDSDSDSDSDDERAGRPHQNAGRNMSLNGRPAH